MTQQIRAKVKVYGVTKHEDPNYPSEFIRISAVYSDDKTTENYSFSKATPSLDMTMAISNPGAFNFFEQGKEYYLDFKPVE